MVHLRGGVNPPSAEFNNLNLPFISYYYQKILILTKNITKAQLNTMAIKNI